MRGLSVVVYGCFDMFHDGHKYLLDAALKNCFEGYISLFLFSNDLCKSIKGNDRPKDDMTTRAGNVEKHIACWSQKHFEYPRLKIFIVNTLADLNDKINHCEPNMIVHGDDYDLASGPIGPWPILLLPCLKDRDGNNFSTSKKIFDLTR